MGYYTKDGVAIDKECGRFSCMSVRVMDSITQRSLTVSCASCETWFG